MTARKVREHPKARAERRAAALWYERREKGLGKRFLAHSIAARKSIEDDPEAWHVYLWWGRENPVIRMRSVPRHPYDIIYFVTAAEIVIVAYAHEAKEPNYWLDRVSD